MGIDLTGKQLHERLSFRDWADAQLLALLHGWEPEGTYYELGDAPEWLGYYYNSNSGQTVTSGDARNMAAALTRALANLVERAEAASAVDLDRLSWPEVMDDPPPPEDQQRRPFETYCGAQGRRRIQDLIAFCHAGGFRIS